ncbi:MAG TPA: DNA oxidative demethylase AlkB [Gammaproteobacteria bacterium]
MTMDIFGDGKGREDLCPGAVVLRAFAIRNDVEIIAAIREIESRSPFRRMITPGGFRMSVAMTNCGAWGWVTDRSGYRYARTDPGNGRPWPEMPAAFLVLAKTAAAQAGFENFTPDACLINRYEPGARLSLHQDRDEQDFGAPVVSVSLGVPAVFLFGGLQRNDKPARVPLAHGDVAVWGGPARLRYHGVAPLKENHHPLTGRQRINLTFRKAA